jgi:glycosyltransferase involved in cell wall biosynthesis
MSLKVLAWPKSSNRSVNPYTHELYSHMREAEVAELALSRRGLIAALGARYDVLHFHWLERAFWSPSRRAACKRVALVFLIVAAARLRGARFLWTVHDPQPHDMPSNRILRRWPFSWLWRAFRRLVLCKLDGLIFQVEDHRRLLLQQEKRLAKLPFIVSPHPHFADSYPNEVSRADACAALGVAPGTAALGFVGNIRPYKNADALIAAFRASELAATLVVAGQVDDPAHRAELVRAAEAEPRILARFEFIPDDQLQTFINALDVLILPFKAPTTSGSAMLGLSFGRPIAVPSSPVFRELQDKVGADWVYLFDGPISPAVLADLLLWAKQPRAERPDLSEFSWSTAAERTYAFMQTLTARPRGAPAPRA